MKCCDLDHDSDGNCPRHPANAKVGGITLTTAKGRKNRNGESVIENTAQASAIEKLAVAAPANGEGILAQEARGQSQVVNQEGEWIFLPTDSKVKLSDYGIEVGEVVMGDPIWRKAKLPAGWKLRAADHSMWSYVVDETGKDRLAIFYKAAFYDRSAFIREA